MPHKVSADMKARIPVLFCQQGFKVKEICGVLGLKKSLVYQTLRYHNLHGVPYNPHAHQHGRKRKLSQGDVRFIVALLNRRHCLYADEIQEKLSDERGVFISLSTLLRTLRRLHYSHKGVSIRALERDDLLRSAFMNRVGDEVTNPNMLMFVDEAARNKRTSGRTKGWSLVGKRCVQRRCFGRGERFSILPILTLDGIITYDIVPGPVSSERFLQFLRELVVRAVFIYVFGLLMQHIDSPFQSLPGSSKCPYLGQLQYPPFRRCACTR
jgi:transposase